MTPAEETNERNACDEWWHAEKRGASVQQAWLERARRAEQDAKRYRKFVEIRDHYRWSECSAFEVDEILDDCLKRGIGRD